MATKRKAREAFGNLGREQLSAFAAAKLAKQSDQTKIQQEDELPSADAGIPVASGANTPCDDVLSEVSIAESIVFEAQSPMRPPISTPVSRFSNFPQTNPGDTELSQELLLDADDTVAFVGNYSLEVINGIATIFSSVVTPEIGIRKIYAPSTHALPLICARQNKTKIRISSFKSGLRKFERLSPLFRNIWTRPGGFRSFAMVRCPEEDTLQRSLYALEIEKDVDVALRTLSAKVAGEIRKPHIMAVGAKSSGKSTFNRALCNHLLSWTKVPKIAYLDLDPGQPEFGPPGQLSLVEVCGPLLGPPFSHPASKSNPSYRLIRSHTLAAKTFKEDPAIYTACALDLFKHVHDDDVLVVNSSGWISGLGATTLLELIPGLGLTDLVLLNPLDHFLSEALQAFKCDFHSILRQAPRPSVRTPAEMRAMQTMSYMHQRTPQTCSNPRWNGQALRDFPPLVIQYSTANPDITAIASYGASPHPDYLSEVLNGSIVAIVISDSTKDNEDDCTDIENSLFLPAITTTTNRTQSTHQPIKLQQSIAHTTEDIPYLKSASLGVPLTLDPATTHCIGLALIHSIDVNNGSMQLHSPLNQDDITELQRARYVFFVRGAFDSPDWAYLEDIHASSWDGSASGTVKAGSDGERIEERPWLTTREITGVEGAVWRLRHPPAAPSRS